MPALLPPPRGRGAGQPLKHGREMGLGLKADTQFHFDRTIRRRCQRELCPFDAPFPQECVRIRPIAAKNCAA
jgi:hypothetical protein